MSTDLKEIKKVIDQQAEVLTKKYKVKSIGVFGSVARGDNTKKSDVDVLVEFSEPIGLFKFIGLENYLSDVLERKVDLVTKKGPAFSKCMKRELVN